MDKDGKITGVTHVTYIKRKKYVPRAADRWREQTADGSPPAVLRFVPRHTPVARSEFIAGARNASAPWWVVECACRLRMLPGANRQHGCRI